MLVGIMIFTTLTILLSVYISFRTGAKPNGNILMGVSLPQEALSDETVLNITKKFKTMNLLTTLILMVLILPIIPAARYSSLVMLYMTLWCMILFYISSKVFARYSEKLAEIKQKNEWWVGERTVVSIDTEVSRLKDTFPISQQWFILPVCIAAVPIAVLSFGGSWDVFSWSVSLIGVSNAIVSFLIFHAFRRLKTVAYCENTEVNMALNRVFKREWSKCCLHIGIIGTLSMTMMFWLWTQNVENSVIVTIGILLSGVCVIACILIAGTKVQSERTRLLRVSAGEIFVDADKYWQGGSYNNPHDNNWMVEKRVGMGMTINEGKKGAKAVVYGSIGLAAFLFIAIAVYTLPMDVSNVSLVINGDTASFSVPFHSQSFLLGDVVGVSKIDEFPRSTRTFGTGAARMSSGRFQVSGYGASRVLVHRNTPPFIVIDLVDGWVFANGHTAEQTEIFYNAIREAVVNKHE